MIQRIQTVFLLIAELLLGIFYVVPFAEIPGKTGIVYRADIQGIYLHGSSNPTFIQHHWPIFLFWVASLILIFITIFSYKNRKLQIKLSIYSLLITIGLVILTFTEVWLGSQKLSGQFSLSIYMLFPIFAALFTFLATRAIRKDEMLVRSVDRIR